MTAAVLKLVLTPGLIAVATLVGRRWGPAVSGAVTGFPLTSLPVSVFLALEQGPDFAATAAVGTLLGLLAQAALCVVYSWAARRALWPMSAAVGVAAFLGVTLVLTRLTVSVWPALGLVAAVISVSAAAMPRGAAPVVPMSPPRWDLPVRMLVATGVVIALTTLAPHLGSKLTGLRSPFPVFTLVLCVFAQRAGGPGAAARLLGGVVVGSLAHAASFALISVLLPHQGLIATYVWASLVAVGVNALAVAVARLGI